MIQAGQLTKTFHRKGETIEAVTDVSFDVADGELVAFLGPNGAGKSTTLRMLTSLLTPTSGTARVAGFDVVAKPAHVRSRIGYIGQGNGAGHSYRVFDEMCNQGRFFHLPHDVYVPRARELLAALELTGVEKRTVQTLSGGQRRRLDVAMGLMNMPPLLFLDEPTTGLDPHARANLWEHVQALREQYGMTIVLTTHYLDEADAMAERVIIIDHGVVIADSTPAALKRDYADDEITVTAVGPLDPADIDRVVANMVPFNDIRVSAHDGSTIVRLRSDHGPEALPPTLAAFTAAGFTVTSAELSQATLDDVFLNLTGRSLREEAA